MRNYAAMAKASGFTDAAVLPVRELVVVPEYRRFCAQNLCGNYGVLPACPPMSGTVEEMTADMRRYQTALILMIETTPVDYWDMAEQKAAKKHQNLLTEQLMEQMRASTGLRPSSEDRSDRPHASCMSAYCVDAQRMADAVHIKCWADDGKIRYFSLILFQSA